MSKFTGHMTTNVCNLRAKQSLLVESHAHGPNNLAMNGHSVCARIALDFDSWAVWRWEVLDAGVLKDLFYFSGSLSLSLGG